MKKAIHPIYHKETTIRCACGNTIKTGSTKEKLEIEICSNCHPFYTGTQKFVDTVGKIERFQAKQKAAASKQAVAKQKVQKKQEDDNRPKTLREMLTATK